MYTHTSIFWSMLKEDFFKTEYNFSKPGLRFYKFQNSLKILLSRFKTSTCFFRIQRIFQIYSRHVQDFSRLVQDFRRTHSKFSSDSLKSKMRRYQTRTRKIKRKEKFSKNEKFEKLITWIQIQKKLILSLFGFYYFNLYYFLGERELKFRRIRARTSKSKSESWKLELTHKSEPKSKPKPKLKAVFKSKIIQSKAEPQPEN